MILLMYHTRVLNAKNGKVIILIIGPLIIKSRLSHLQEQSEWIFLYGDFNITLPYMHNNSHQLIVN